MRVGKQNDKNKQLKNLFNSRLQVFENKGINKQTNFIKKRERVSEYSYE